MLEDAPLHRALAGLRDRGVAVGISTSGPAQGEVVRRALGVEVDGTPLFTSLQSTWNVLETSAAPALAEAAAAGARVLVKEPVANGRLAPGGEARTPGVARLHALALGLGVGADVLAIAAALAQPWARPGPVRRRPPEQVASNAAATRLDVPADVLSELAGLAEPPQAYWAARLQRPWS